MGIILAGLGAVVASQPLGPGVPGAGKEVQQGLGVKVFRVGQELADFVQLADKGVNPGDDGFGIGDADVPVHYHIAGGQAGQVPIAGGGDPGNVVPVGAAGGAGHQGNGKHKGQMAGGGDKAVVFLGADVKGLGANGFDHSGDFGGGALSGFDAGDDAPGFALKEVGFSVFRPGGFLAGHGMAADKGYAVRQILVGPIHNHFFGTAQVGNDAALRQVGGQDFQHFLHRHNGGGEDDDVGILHGVEQAVFDLVESLGALGGGTDAAVGVGADHFQVEQLGLAQGQGQGCTHQAGANDSDFRHLPNLPGGCPPEPAGECRFILSHYHYSEGWQKGGLGGAKTIRLVRRERMG